jgi:hypothetical protein
MKLASKSKKRLDLLNAIQEGILKFNIPKPINTSGHDSKKNDIYSHVLLVLTEFVMIKHKFCRGLAREKSRTMIKWEGNSNTNVKDIRFMGITNRPKMTIESDGVIIAIESIEGGNLSVLKEAIAQSMIYSTAYDFVIYMFVDNSKEHRILNGSSLENEKKFLQNMWDNFNVKFTII